MTSVPRSAGKLVRKSLTNPKLEEAFQAHGQSGHRFERKTFTRPTYCHHCTDLLWGLTNQGFICEVCNFVTHERCLADVIIPCVSIAMTLVKHPVAHTWSGPLYFKRKFCHVCRKRIEDHLSFRCQACEYYVHEDCREFSVSDCKQCSTYIPSCDKRFIQHGHHWREGVPTSSKCAYCKRTCFTAENLASMRCSWCATTAHSGCFHYLPKQCNFGYLHRLVLPSYAVSVPNIQLWSSCSRSRVGSAGSKQGKKHILGGESYEMEDNLISDEESFLSIDERPESSNTFLRIYDGELTSPRMYKQVKVHRTAQVNQVLEEALKKFHITDDPKNYYLTRTVDQNSERQLEPEELPMQFCENGSKPLIFLRMKNADRRKGYIKVYPGMINATVAKTVPVTPSTMCAEVIPSLLTKFGLKDDANDYCLTVTHLHHGVQERRMKDHECPWKTLMEERKKSVRRMKTTRFYLRRNLEPVGSVKFCVGGLPTCSPPDKARYETILQDILEETMQFCDIESIYSSSGMAFLKFPAADVASDAFEKLSKGIFDERHLFVKLLPNIYPETFHSDCEPLLVFINSRSGGGQGEDMLATFQRSLNIHQVCNLSDGGPLPWLYTFKDLPKFRILVCGGDGTVGWVLSCLDDVCHELKCHSPPSAIVPLGTGNDLARVLRWGSAHSGSEDPMSLLMAVDQADRVSLDRWTVMFDNTDPYQFDARSDDSAIGSVCEEEPNLFVMNNYFSIGLDAELCLEFHMKREEKPERFTSRLHNKGVYVRSGIRKMMKRSSKMLQDDIEIEVDGKKIDLPVLEGIVLLNIGSWAAGANLWGSHTDDNFVIPSYSDGMLEVIGLNGVMHMGQIQSSIRGGIQLAQGSQINIKLKSDWPVQIDGEPWMQSAGHVIVRPVLMQAKMLRKRKARVKTAPAYPRMARQATIGTSTPSSNEVARSVFHTPLSP